LLPTLIDGSITVPQSGGSPLTYLITNNYNVFYLVRGDAAAAENRNLDTSQPADSTHWYIYRWVDLTGSAGPNAVRTASTSQAPLVDATWGHLKAGWR
jgi:hypothetical protein